jgi:hypothetical protein
MTTLTDLLTLALDPSRLFQAQGMTPDPWQTQVLLCPSKHILLNCSRGAGKSRVTSVLALHTALFHPGSLTLLISRSLRQSKELLRYIKQAYRAIGKPLPATRSSDTHLELSTGSRILALPGKEETIRTFQGVNLLILDEASRIPDMLYGSVRPMVGTANGRTLCLSTPFGQRGFFWRSWCDDTGPWTRFRIPWTQCPRLTPEFIAQERRQFGDSWVSQEYECDFTACDGRVYPDFDKAIVHDWTPPAIGKRVGGIDWGFRNPFAAVWGIVDKNDILWIEAERYQTQATLRDHAAALPKGITWYADPSGPTEIHEFRTAGHTIRAGRNDIRAGIQAVTSRLQTGRLKVNAANCPNLLREAGLYHYPRDADGETPVDAHNHALSALRYLISRLDAHLMARTRRGPAPQEPQPAKPRATMDMNNPDLWT